MPETQERVAAGLILRRRLAKHDVWLLLKARKHGEWGFPKGHLDPGETVLQAALRECVEESGIALVEIEDAPTELRYRLPDGGAKRVVYFPASTATSVVRLSDEHSRADWFTAAQVEAHLPHPNLVMVFRTVRMRQSR